MRTDKLNNPVAIKAAVEDSSISVETKSRAFAAFDRLIGNLLDLPNPLLEGINSRRRLRNELRERLIETATDKSVEDSAEVQALGKAILRSNAEKEIRAFENKASIVLEAAIELEAGSDQSTSESSTDELNEDWMNVFETHAENASSEHLRKLWSRILAGEIRKPGSFSLSTLRTISELDRKIAELFQTHVDIRFVDGFILQPEEMKNQLLLDLTFLEEVGLLQDVNGTIGRNLEADSSGCMYIRNGKKVLRITPKPSSQTLRLKLIRITRVGIEIASILPENESGVLIKYANTIRQKVEKLEIGNVVKQLDDGRSLMQNFQRI